MVSHYTVSKIDKIQFESNSQLWGGAKQLHITVSKIDKIQFESNSQRGDLTYKI